MENASCLVRLTYVASYTSTDSDLVKVTEIERPSAIEIAFTDFRLVRLVGSRSGRSPGQEHGATAHVVCDVQPVDGAAHAAAGDAGMSAPAGGQRAAKRGEIDLKADLVSQKCHHPKSNASAHAAAGVVQTIPSCCAVKPSAVT